VKINSANDTYFNLALIAMFTVLSIIGIRNHEIWLDEAHHWLLARDSTSIIDLYNNMRYEGHPMLWNLILFVFTRFSINAMGMQIINIIISICAVALFVFYAPFNKTQKSLFMLGNFILYEYTVISRNYSLLLLFLFLSIIFYHRKNYIMLGVSLAILANTHLFGLIIGGALITSWLFEVVVRKTKTWKPAAAISLILFSFGALISLVQVIPPYDSLFIQHMTKHNELERLARTSTVFVKGFIPISDFTSYHFWNTNLLMTLSKPLCAVLSSLLLLYPIVFFKRDWPLLLYFYMSTAIMLLFFYLSDLNAPRYYGIVYITFISVLWLSSEDSTETDKKLSGHRKIFFISILTIQLVAGVINYAIDLTRPFSESKNVFTSLNPYKEKSVFIAGGCGAAPIAAYLGEKMYYISNKDYGSYCRFNREAEALSGDESFQKKEALKFAQRNTQPVYFITHKPLHLNVAEVSHFHLEAAFDKSALRHENYFVYRVSKREIL
jgi:hypothetical protein